MNDTTAVPLIVHSATRDPVEALNGLLRRGGMAAHCTWISAPQDLPDALEQLNPELLICCAPAGTGLTDIARMRDQVAGMVPLVAVRDKVDEAVIDTDMAQGARDTVSLQQPGRLQAVIARELRAFRLERALTSTLRASQDYRSQLEVVLQRSNDAIAQIQEGILVDANAAWVELFGAAEAGSLVGQPVMDLFADSTHAALKAALTACLQGRWNNHTLKADATLADGSVAPLELVLALGEYDGEPSVRLIVPVQKRDERALATELEAAVHCDQGTGLLMRRHLLHALQERLRTPVAGGVRYVVCVRPDRFADIERDLGVLSSEQFVIALTQIVRALLGPHDIAGHFGGTTLLLLLERGNGRDVEAWCESLIDRVSKHLFPTQSSGDGLHATCSVGMAPVPQQSPDLNACVMDALDALRRGRARGAPGSWSRWIAPITTPASRATIRSGSSTSSQALMENRFRLVQQPIAALAGGSQKMFDVAIRMLDTQGKEVLPSEFLPAASRNDLMKNIDRWVWSLAVLPSKNKPDLLFVRLSRDSALDSSLLQWLELQLRSTVTEAQRLCLQVTEEVASNNVQQTTAR